jgi:sulfate adenylyltransferase/3'-phosphoadenosine 5'-phosphosulfate synthase
MTEGFVVWLTGLSGAGKTTMAQAVAARVRASGRAVQILDGDHLRKNLNHGLGFSRADRDTNIRRIAYVAKLLSENGIVVVVAAISPYRAIRDEARAQLKRFVEVYVKCTLEELVRRDTKGLYARAQRGEISNFTGVSDPYEEPLIPEVTLNTDVDSVRECVDKIMTGLDRAGYFKTGETSIAAARAGASGADQTIAPHGGTLVNRMAKPDEVAAWRVRASSLPSITLNARQLSDVEMIGIGAFSPLTGFMGSADYDSVIEDMHLTNGLVWPIPVTLATTPDVAESLKIGGPVALRNASGDLVAILDLAEIYSSDPEREASKVYRTTETAHPGVAALYQQGPILLAGAVIVIDRPPTAFPAYRLDPEQTRALFASRGWRRVVGFQTRNPVHRAHEYIQKAALEIVDGLLLHPLVGETKGDDIPADVRMRCYEVLLDNYYPKDRAILAINPAAMRYAGPREAIFHALIRQNYGCTHFIVGRDHAGVGNYYGTYDAQQIFDRFRPGEIGITPLMFEHTFYCRTCGGVVSAKTCPHDKSHHIVLSGTQVRNMLRAGEALPGEFTRPEVAAILTAAMAATPA